MDVTKESLSVVNYDACRKSDWDGYVERSKTTTLAHELCWKTVVEKTYGHRAFYLMAYRDGQVAGVLPLFLVKSVIFGKFLITSPYLTCGGIDCVDEDAANILVDRARDIAEENGVDYAEIRNVRRYRCLSEENTNYVSFVLDLALGNKGLWENLKKKRTRWSIRKAFREGLEVVEGKDNLSAFIDIYTRSMRRLGTPSHSREFFLQIINNVPQVSILMVKKENAYVGGMITIKRKNTMEVPWAASLKECFYLQPNTFLYWKAIEIACREGCDYFIFGRSKYDSGTYHFKKQFGAQADALYYQYILHKRRQMPHVYPDNKTFRPLIAVWKKLPLFLTREIGPFIIQDIP